MKQAFLVLKKREDLSLLKLLNLFKERREISFSELMLKLRPATFYNTLTKIRCVEGCLKRFNFFFFTEAKRVINFKEKKVLVRHVLIDFLPGENFVGVVFTKENGEDQLY